MRPAEVRTPLLRLRNVSKSRGGRLAARRIALNIDRGSTTAVVGPSGCGKSTLLALMIGLLVPDEGSVAFDGVELTPSNAALLRRRMGYVVQDGGLFPHLSAKANVVLMAERENWEATRIRERLLELADAVALSKDDLERHPGELSGGQRQRIALMRALMLDPDLLLLDEPLGALDPMIRTGLQDRLQILFQSLNKTVVIVTHDLPEAALFGDRILVMQDGAIAQSGTFAELRSQPASPFVSQFLAAQRTLPPISNVTT